uniref:capsid cement protein n=1 Tax=Lachnospira sp. TaxID=2049031 RepID=UPI004025474C
MATYFGTSINESPTVVFPAKEKIEGAQGIALVIDGGELTKPTAGANVIGLSLFTNDETVEAGDDITVQVKDIGKWIAGEAVEAGDELATDAEGKAVKATSGSFITAVALSGATAKGDVIGVQIIKAGYKA